jgi:hypothetical protein
MKMAYFLAGAVVIAGGAAVFGSKITPTPETRGSTTESSNRPALEELQPFGAPPRAPSTDDVLAGVVLEKLDVPSYTYLRIGAPGSEGQWAAVSTAKIEVGEKVRVRSQTVMTNFESRTLERTFETIRFGVLDGADSVAAVGTNLPPGHPSVGGAELDPRADVPVGKVEKATGPNTRRVAEIFGQKKQLAGKPVRVRGVIVKVTHGVMGKNFAHIKDGSGAPASKDDDLTVTSSVPMQRGQTVMLEGKLELDQNLGAGYAYDVILTDAKIVE